MDTLTATATDFARPTDPDAIPNAYPAVAEAAEAVAALARRAADYDDADAARRLTVALTHLTDANRNAARSRNRARTAAPRESVVGWADLAASSAAAAVDLAAR